MKLPTWGSAVALLVVGLALLPWPPDEARAAPAPESVPEPRLGETVRWLKVRSATVAFDGTGRVVALGDDATGVVELRRLPDGMLLAKVRTAGIGGTKPHTLTLSGDGKTVVALASDGMVRLYRVGTKGEVEIETPQHISSSPLALSRDGKRLATLVRDHAIRQWDTATGRSLARPIETGDITDTLAWGPDGKLIAADHYEGPFKTRIAVWDAATGRKLPGKGFVKSRAASLLFSPDGKTLAAGDQNGMLKLLDVPSGKCRHELKGHADAVWALAFSPDGKTLTSTGAHEEDGSLRFWDVASGKLRAKLPAHTLADATALVFSSNGRTLWSGDKRGFLKRWDVPRTWKAK